MTSTSMKAVTTKLILKPIINVNCHGHVIQTMSYFPDGQRIISGSEDRTARQWDLKTGKEIEEARDVCEEEVWAVAVSRDGQWVVTGGGDLGRAELKVCGFETGIVKAFKGHSLRINYVDISADNKLLASGSWDSTVRIWSLDTGELVAGPFQCLDWVGVVRFSTDSKKLAVKSWTGKRLEVWDVQSQKLDVRIGKVGRSDFTHPPVFWTNNDKNIITTFNFTRNHEAITIYELNASTLKTVGTPFKGHTKLVNGLAFSFDRALLASASIDNTIKLWDYESRQLLASFDVWHSIYTALAFSPDSRHLAYTTLTDAFDYNICICDVLAQASTSSNPPPLNPDSQQSAAVVQPPSGEHGGSWSCFCF